MAMTLQDLARRGTSLAVLGFAIVSLTDLPPVDMSDPDPQELQELIEQIQGGAAEEQAEETADEAGLAPFATPCLMRRPRMATNVDQKWRHGFAAATLTNNPEQRVALLQELLKTAPDDQTRWRVDIALLEAALRIDDKDAARQHLSNAATRNVPATCRADEAVFAASLAENAQSAAALLASAVELDPGLWIAQEQLAVLSTRGTGTDATTCETDAVRTLETVIQLGALAQKDTQFQRLNRALEAMPISGRTALLRGMILRQTGEPAAALTAYQNGLATLGQSACDAIIREGLVGMISATESNL